jgi:hypothetical protein
MYCDAERKQICEQKNTPAMDFSFLFSVHVSFLSCKSREI